MKYLFDNIPIAIVIAGICVLMLYPYIGAGLLLAALCFEAEQYVLMVLSFFVCVALQIIMTKRIRPHHVPVQPSRASRREKKKKKRPSSGIIDKTTESVAAEASDPLDAENAHDANDADGAHNVTEEGDIDGGRQENQTR